MTENVIEWITNEERATVTFSQGRFKTRIRKLAEEYPDEIEIAAENKDGSICAHIPTSWVRITPPKKHEATEEEKERLRQMAEAYRNSRKQGKNGS